MYIKVCVGENAFIFNGKMTDFDLFVLKCRGVNVVANGVHYLCNPFHFKNGMS